MRGIDTLRHGLCPLESLKVVVQQVVGMLSGIAEGICSDLHLDTKKTHHF